MTYPDLSPLSPDLLARAAAIKLACFDVDGTLTDGRLYFDNEGRESKAFHILDGQGLVLMRKAGIAVALVTARLSPAAEIRGRGLGVPVHTGVKDKLAKVRELADEHHLSLEQVAFMGDDLPDLAPFKAVGLAIAPANAHPWTAAHAHWQTIARGGEGAAREACDLILAVQGHVDAILQGRLS